MQSLTSRLGIDLLIHSTLVTAVLIGMTKQSLVVAGVGVLLLITYCLWIAIRSNSGSAQDKQAWLQQIGDANIDATVCVDGELTILSINQAAERILGYDADELIGESIGDLWPNPDQVTSLRTAVQDNLAEDLPIDSRVRYEMGYRRDGSLFPMEIAVSPISTAQGRYALINIRESRATLPSSPVPTTGELGRINGTA